MDLLYVIYWTYFVMAAFQLGYSYNHHNLLILVSFDGFRHDYIDRGLSPTLDNLLRQSTHAPYMTSVFPTKTFPNHFSIATGVYSEVHGVLDSNVYDKFSNKTLSYGYELFHYNENVVPIWILNERGGGGRHSGCMMWTGCDFDYQGSFLSHFMAYNSSIRWEQRVDTLLGWFTDPHHPINLGLLYFEQPDATAHQYGPDSVQVDEQIARVDGIVQYLLIKAQNAGLLRRLNLVFLSDHGFQSIKLPEHIIDLDNFVDKSFYRRYGVPPNLQIYPKRGKEAAVIKAFRSARHKKGGNFSTYTRLEMLEHWHYRGCGRTPPILLTADLGYLFKDDSFRNVSEVIGDHGYDPLAPTMRAFFMAVGPMFKKGYRIRPFENIHIYPLAAHILDLELPVLRPNGRLDVLKDVLLTQKSLWSQHQHGSRTI